MRIVNAGTDEGGYIETPVPPASVALSWGALESREKVEAEVDLMLTTIRDFHEMEPDQVGRLIMAMSARCTELCIHLHRLEHHRQWRQLRTQQCERLIDEMKRQWAIASRLIEMRKIDLELIK